MADLYRIFNEDGLAGLIPYSLRDTSHGYQIILDKIKSGYPLSFICTKMEVPFLVVKNNTYQALFYTSSEKAELQITDLKAQHYQVEVEDLPDGKGRNEALHWLFDHGPTHILLDDSLSIPISDLVTTELPDYDGQPTTEHLLRNRNLNGATFYYFQQTVAGYGNMDAEQHWASLMFHGKMLVPCINDPKQNYPAMGMDVKGHYGILVYSDWRQLLLDMESPAPTCIVVDFSMLKELLNQHENNVLVFNHATCNLVMDMDMLLMIEELATTTKRMTPTGQSIIPSKTNKAYRLGQVDEDDWDKIDPTPDFLK